MSRVVNALRRALCPFQARRYEALIIVGIYDANSGIDDISREAQNDALFDIGPGGNRDSTNRMFRWVVLE
jgi:hypothetical protein